MTLEIYDLQAYPNYIVFTGYRPKTGEWFIYRIGEGINEYEALMEHLESGLLMVGFDNIYHDWQILQNMLDCRKMFQGSNGTSICGQMMLRIAGMKDGTIETIPEFRFTVRQIDLFRMWHLYNKNRRATLNDIKFSCRMSKIYTLPYSYDSFIADKEPVDAYSKNNVEAIHRFFLTTIGRDDYPIYKGINKIAFREELRKEYGVQCLNTADAVLGKKMILVLYSKAVGLPIAEIREMKTARDTINLGSCIPWFCNVKTQEFTNVLDTWKKTVIKSDTENDVKIPAVFHDTQFVFTLGGLHSVAKPGIYESDNDFVIMDYDVQSLYPSLGRLLELYPEHLGPVFTKLYSKFLDLKLEEAKKENPDKAKIGLLKLVLNAIYGNSNEPKSFLYDPLYTYKTTIAGQVFTAMWCEMLATICPNIEFISVNTDGICCKIPRDKQELILRLNDKIYGKFGFLISVEEYERLIVKDVNNYIAIYPGSTRKNEHVKLRGCFDTSPDYYGDTSKRAIPKALKEFFVYGVPIEESIKNNPDVYDFCLKIKPLTGGSVLYRTIQHAQIETKNLGEFARYYITKSGPGSILRVSKSGTQTLVHPGKSCALFNLNWGEKPMINYSFYISEANKIKDSVVSSQLTLF